MTDIPPGGARTIRKMMPGDANSILEIYEDGIRTGNATFNTIVPAWNDWDTSHLTCCRFVACDENGDIIGWVALSAVSARVAYCGVAEVSVYVKSTARGVGVGTQLLQRVVDASEVEGIWTLQAGIFPENAASIALHQRCGFRTVGVRERIGKLAGVWRSVVLLERRSPGID